MRNFTLERLKESEDRVEDLRRNIRDMIDMAPPGGILAMLGRQYLDRDRRAADAWMVKHMKEMEDAGK